MPISWKCPCPSLAGATLTRVNLPAPIDELLILFAFPVIFSRRDLRSVNVGKARPGHWPLVLRGFGSPAWGRTHAAWEPCS